MRYLPLRRGQLVTTFGPGSLVVDPFGESAIIGSLDKWYYDINEIRINNIDEFEVDEPRLKSMLKVDKLYLPPDYRPGYEFNKPGNVLKQTNTDVYIPLLRFPTWHYCPECKTLHQSKMTNRTSWMDCKKCKHRRKMIQVPFVIVCEQGHISDFPWREWVHEDENTTCEGLMSLVTTGGATLDSLKVVCSCNKERPLRGIMSRKEVDNNDENISELSKRLNENGDLYKCPGHKLWQGTMNENENCTSYPVAVLKNSLNVYFPNTISAIYLPGENPNVERLLNILHRSGLKVSLLEMVEKMDKKIEMVKELCPPEILEFKTDEIETAILYFEGKFANDDRISDSTEKDLRNKELKRLISEVNSEQLKVRSEWRITANEEDSIINKFSLINRVTKLKETIVLTGFNRLIANNEMSERDKVRRGRSLLFKNPDSPNNNWLPAYEAFGEGIFFILNKEKLASWEQENKVKVYFNKLINRANNSKTVFDENILKPRNVLIHTLAHLIIDELALTCGYNSASLKERLYINDGRCGVLIYTASGDVDGTFGGLVRMGRGKNFFPVVRSAIEKSRWCSSDPVCSEIGKSTGQGVLNLNGAACHSCSYLPETSCEYGNLFLDRTLLIDPDIGFFNN